MSRLTEELFSKEQKKQTSSLGLLWFSSDTLKVLNFCLSSSVLSFTFFFSRFSFFALTRRIGSKLGVEPRTKKARTYPLAASILSYDIRMVTIIILVLIIILYPLKYLLIKMTWMYLTLYSVNINWIFFFPHSWSGRSQSDVVWNVRVEFATKTLLPWRTDICCLSKVMYMSEKCACAWETEKCRYLGLWFHFDPFEKCSYFSSLGFLRYR